MQLGIAVVARIVFSKSPCEIISYPLVKGIIGSALQNVNKLDHRGL